MTVIYKKELLRPRGSVKKVCLTLFNTSFARSPCFFRNFATN